MSSGAPCQMEYFSLINLQLQYHSQMSSYSDSPYDEINLQSPFVVLLLAPSPNLHFAGKKRPNKQPGQPINPTTNKRIGPKRIKTPNKIHKSTGRASSVVVIIINGYLTLKFLLLHLTFKRTSKKFNASSTTQPPLSFFTAKTQECFVLKGGSCTTSGESRLIIIFFFFN